MRTLSDLQYRLSHSLLLKAIAAGAALFVVLMAADLTLSAAVLAVAR